MHSLVGDLRSHQLLASVSEHWAHAPAFRNTTRVPNAAAALSAQRQDVQRLSQEKTHTRTRGSQGAKRTRDGGQAKGRRKKEILE